MGYSQSDLKAFYTLFTSNEKAYGMTVVGDIVNGKAEARSHLEHNALTAAVIGHHLAGEISIGAAPLRDGNTVRWCAIDIDDYQGNIQDVIDAIIDFDIPLLPCYSKSKKLHIYCFFTEEVPAIDAINMMKWYATAFRCDAKVEIFPKQSKTSSNNKFYSWINLPYFHADSDNHRKCVGKNGKLLTLSEFVELAQEKQLSLTEHLEFIKTLPYYGAPPCVQSGVLLRDVPPGTRNNWFYNVACYLRMGDEDIDITEPLLDLNDQMHTPLPEREIRTTVAKVASRSYFYQCTSMPGCNKTICKSSEKGIGSNSSTKFNFGQLTKILTDPIQWEWEINNSVLRFQDTSQIMNQNEFRRQCMEKINDMPFKVKDEKWTSIIRRALENVVEKQEELYGNFGKGSQFLSIVSDYFSNVRKYTKTQQEVITYGKLFKESEQIQFNSNDFAMFVTDKNDLKIPQTEIRIRLVELGAHQVNGLVWSIAESKAMIRSIPTPTIDYHDPTEDESIEF